MRVKPLDPNAQATRNAMSAFHTALAQLQATTPQVDANALRAPYDAASTAAGQLGQGLQAALAQSGQNAQQQYTQGLGQAQQQAAQFGISAGAGAQPTALQNTGTQLLAQQSQAQQAAAPQAAVAWQQLLGRTAAAKVSDANLARQNLIASGSASLAGAIPSAINAEKTLGFQQRTQRENMGLARSQLTVKQQTDLQSYLLGAAKVQQSGQVAATRADQTAASQAETKRHNRATEQAANKKLSVAQQKATASGIKGISAVNSFLKAQAGAKGPKPVTGYNITINPGPNSVDAGAPQRTFFVKDAANAKAMTPPGWTVTGDPKPVTGQATTGSAAPLSRAKWNQALAQLKGANPPGTPVSRLIPLLPPRPKK